MRHIQLFIQIISQRPNYGVAHDSQRQCAYFIVHRFCGYRIQYVSRLFNVSITSISLGLKRQRGYLQQHDATAVQMYNEMLETFIDCCKLTLHYKPASSR